MRLKWNSTVTSEKRGQSILRLTVQNNSLLPRLMRIRCRVVEQQHTVWDVAESAQRDAFALMWEPSGVVIMQRPFGVASAQLAHTYFFQDDPSVPAMGFRYTTGGHESGWWANDRLIGDAKQSWLLRIEVDHRTYFGNWRTVTRKLLRIRQVAGKVELTAEIAAKP